MADPILPDAALAGLPPRLALWRLLHHRGQVLSLAALDEEGEAPSTPEDLLQRLRGRGLEGRFVQAHGADLGHLGLPTLALTHRDEWILLRSRTRRGWQVEHGGGAAEVTEADLRRSLSGMALELGPAFPEEGGLWGRLLRLLPAHRDFLLMSLGASALAQGLALISPWLTRWMMDGALAKGSGSLLQILCVGMILGTLFRAWVGWLRDTTLNAFATRIDVDLERGLFDHLLHLPFRYLQGKTLGELLQSFSGIKRARTLVLNRGLSAIFDACTAVVFLVYMLMLLPALAGVVILGALALSLASALVGYLQARVARLQIRAGQAESSALAELLNGVPTLKATGSQRWVLERWRERLGVRLAHALHQERLGLWESAISELLTQGSSICILIWGGYKVLGGELSLGQLLAFSQLSGAFVGTVTSLGQTVVALALAKPQLAQVQETFATARQPRAPLHGPRELTGPVVAEDVWFRYDAAGPWILRGQSLRVEPGTFHHLKGASGSGKSTFLKVLAGLYEPASGQVSLGNLDRTAASSLMVVLPQFPQLSSGSILDNLRIFSGEVSRAHLMQVAEETGLDAWVRTLPMGYQTLMTSGGGNLSGGQRQLVAITAVLASDKQLLLLDEALSNLDWVSRQRVLACPRFRGRTIIYASHEEILGREALEEQVG